MTPSTSPLAAVVGTGPGLGTALAARFAAGGYTLALLSRSEQSRQDVLAQLVAQRNLAWGYDGDIKASRTGCVTTTADGHLACGYDCDAGDPASVAAAFARIRDTQGQPSVLVYNAGMFLQGGILELDPARFEAAWRVNCLGAYLAAREVLPAMLDAGCGTILFTGATAALRGGAGFAGLAVGKFGLRALAQSTAREFAPRGIHVAHVVIDGRIGTPAARERQPDADADSFLDPAAIAESYWQLCQQPRSAWTLELDLRPAAEKF